MFTHLLPEIFLKKIDIWIKYESLFLQAGTFDLVGMIVYEVDQLPYQNIFYNGTIEVTEAGGLVSVETLFLISLGFALFVLFGLWVRGQMQNLSKVMMHNHNSIMVL